MNERKTCVYRSLDRSIISTLGILRHHAMNPCVRKIAVSPTGTVFIHCAPHSRCRTGEHTSEGDLRQIMRAVEMLPESAVRRTCGNWEANKVEVVFTNGWSIRAKKSRIWSQHSLVFRK